MVIKLAYLWPLAVHSDCLLPASCQLFSHLAAPSCPPSPQPLSCFTWLRFTRCCAMFDARRNFISTALRRQLSKSKYLFVSVRVCIALCLSLPTFLSFYPSLSLPLCACVCRYKCVYAACCCTIHTNIYIINVHTNANIFQYLRICISMCVCVCPCVCLCKIVCKLNAKLINIFQLAEDQ